MTETLQKPTKLGGCMKRLIPFLLCFALVLPGCAAKTDDGTRTVAEGTGAGVVAGAVLGGILAIATGDAKWVAIGAGVGGVIGLGAGVYVAKKKEEYATQEQWLDACIKEAQSSNKAIASYNAQLRKRLGELNLKSTRLAADYNRQAAKASDMKAMQNAIAEQQKANDTYISNAEKQIARQKGYVRDARAEKKNEQAAIIEEEISRMEVQVAELREESSKLASMSMRVSI